MDAFQQLREDLPDGIEVHWDDPRGFDGPWDPAEAAVIERAAPKRRKEFGCGRRLARLGLARLGANRVSLLRGTDRRPNWPQGIVGSIAHCVDACVAMVAKRPPFAALGIDVERSGPLRPELTETVASASERVHWTRGRHEDWAKATFVAKEAFYKAQYESTRNFLEFHDVRCIFEHEPEQDCLLSFRCTPHRGPDLAGRIFDDGAHVLAWVVDYA
ncbi:MAG: 4'-phosphopantetheinyl transferase [Myxococcota bacterium]